MLAALRLSAQPEDTRLTSKRNLLMEELRPISAEYEEKLRMLKGRSSR